MDAAREQTRTRSAGTRNTTTNGDPAAKLAALRDIVAEKAYAKIDGMMVDLFSASVIVKVHDALTPENQAKFLGLPIQKMATIAYKLIG
jgi:hypothetical protein